MINVDQVIYANEAASRLWQKDPQKLCKKPFDLLFLGDETLLSKLYQALRHGKEFNAKEYQIDAPNLRQGIFELSISPVYEDGKIISALITLYDTQRSVTSKRGSRSYSSTTQSECWLPRWLMKFKILSAASRATQLK